MTSRLTVATCGKSTFARSPNDIALHRVGSRASRGVGTLRRYSPTCVGRPRSLMQYATVLTPFDIRTARLRSVLGDVSAALREHSILLESFGFEDVLELDFDALTRGMRSQHLPDCEAELLSHLGFPRIARSLDGLVASVRHTAAERPFATNACRTADTESRATQNLLADRSDVRAARASRDA